jgi:hypothetical protein
MKIVRFLLALLSFSISAAPLTHHDKEILEQLNLADTEALTQDSFNELISHAQLNGKRFALAVVRDTSGDKNFFYDLVSLFSAIETNKKFENPINRQSITSIRIYLLSNQPHFYGPEGGRLKQYHPSKGPMNLSRKPWLEGNKGDDFVGELHAKPQEGFYKYMKNHGIETTGFIEPYKHYTPANLPTDIEELRAIVRGDYPLDLAIVRAAQLSLAKKLLLEHEVAQNGDDFTESENISQTLIDDLTVPAAIWDQAAYILMFINALKFKKFITGHQPQDELQILNLQNKNLLLVRRLTRPDTTLNNNQLYFTRNNYLGAAIGTQQPIQEIRDIALSIAGNPLTPDAFRQLAINGIRQMYNHYKRMNESNSFITQEVRAYMQEYINTFPNGEIIP